MTWTWKDPRVLIVIWATITIVVLALVSPQTEFTCYGCNADGSLFTPPIWLLAFFVALPMIGGLIALVVGYLFQHRFAEWV